MREFFVCAKMHFFCIFVTLGYFTSVVFPSGSQHAHWSQRTSTRTTPTSGIVLSWASSLAAVTEEIQMCLLLFAWSGMKPHKTGYWSYYLSRTNQRIFGIIMLKVQTWVTHRPPNFVFFSTLSSKLVLRAQRDLQSVNSGFLQCAMWSVETVWERGIIKNKSF